jgi:hypothetical protein
VPSGFALLGVQTLQEIHLKRGCCPVYHPICGRAGSQHANYAIRLIALCSSAYRYLIPSQVRS